MDILDQQIAALKADLDVTDLSNALLSPAQQDVFLDAMEMQTKLLPLIRSVQMTRDKQNIDSIAFYGRVTVSGKTSTGGVRTITENDEATLTHEQNVLEAQELVATYGIKDRLVKRVLEQGNFANHVLTNLGRGTGRDYEEMIILGDKNIAYADDDILCQTDGFAKLSYYKLYGGGDNPSDGWKTEDPDDPQWILKMFDAMLNELPEQYHEADDLAFLIDKKLRNSLLDVWGYRGTAMGDQILTTGILPPYKGVKPVYVPTLSRAKPYNKSKAYPGRICTLTSLANMNAGVFQEVNMEPKRIPEGATTRWFLRYEGDGKLQEKKGSVTSYLDAEAP